ncbi:unnamed protein product, partial [Brenthis ino]
MEGGWAGGRAASAGAAVSTDRAEGSASAGAGSAAVGRPPPPHDHGGASATRAARPADRRAAPRQPRRVWRSGHLQIPCAERSDAQSAGPQRRARADLRSRYRRSRTTHC